MVKEKKKNGMIRTAKSIKKQNDRRKGKLQILVDIRSSEDERKNKRVSPTNENTSRNQALQEKSHQRDKHLGCLPVEIHGTIPDD